MLTINSPEILAFMDKIQKAKEADFAEKFPFLDKPKYVCERGTKYIAIDIILHPNNEGYQGRSVFCFIAADDSTTKTLGSVKKGDILKSAGYKTPAKKARGNIFAADGGMGGVSLYGANYL